MSGGVGAEHRIQIDGHLLAARVTQSPDGLYLRVSTLTVDGATIDAAHLALEPSAAADGGWELAELADAVDEHQLRIIHERFRQVSS